MINLESENAILLAPFKKVKASFLSCLMLEVHSLEQENSELPRPATKKTHAIRFFKENIADLKDQLNQDSFDSLIKSCFQRDPNLSDQDAKKAPVSADVLYHLVGKSCKNIKDERKRTYTRIIRSTFIYLWIKELIVLPKRFTTKHVPLNHILEIARESDSVFLRKVVEAHPSSEIENVRGVSQEIRKHLSSYWVRLILNTNWTARDKISEEDITSIIKSGQGSTASLVRYFPNDFLFYLSHDDQELLETYRRICSDLEKETQAERDEQKRKRKENEKQRQKRAKSKSDGPRTQGPSNTSKIHSRIQHLISFYSGQTEECNPSSLFRYFNNQTIRRIFVAENLNVDDHPLYSQLDPKVREFTRIIYQTFEGFTASQRVSKVAPYRFDTALLLCYTSIYLPRFFLERDGDLSHYPVNFNDFTCSYFVVRNEYLSALMEDEKEAPKTVFQFIEDYGEHFEWNWSTGAYSHLKRLQNYFEYIERNSQVIPNADSFRTTITDSDIPQTKRRSTTNKKIIPREYFRVFLSLLETLDYFIEHINGMADGVNPGIMKGQLVTPTYYELVTVKHWESLFAPRSKRLGENLIDTEVLNYTPVILFDGRYYPLKKTLRFYSLAQYRVNGVDQQRAAPHVPRILWLMANTGIRQQHLIWLDKDTFDSAINNKLGALAPLIVNTDKAHDEWVSVVSKDVIEVCRRQREWLERNELEVMHEPTWYMNIEKHKFGKYVPLFRLPISQRSWHVHEHTGKVMWILEKFLRHQVGETECPTLAYWKPSESKNVEGKLSDHIVGIDEFDSENVDSTWKWDLFSEHTPHSLRASFVSDHMRFLPPSLIGRHMTGQFSQSLVWYYTIMDAEDMGDHQQMLINLLMKNEDKIRDGGAPELADKISDINRIIAKDIDSDPEGAISKHGLFSLSDVDDQKNGVAALRARQNTQPAYNTTHICPFNNVCPEEVVKKYGLGKPCSVCPYAIRGVMHLPALNAEKFKYVELMRQYEQKIKSYRQRPDTGMVQAEIESLEAEHDRLARDAYALEAIEQQLYHMRDANDHSYVAQDAQSIRDLYENLELDTGEYLIKRLVDIQIFSDLDSPKIQQKFAHLRYKLMLSNGDIEALLKEHEEPEHALLASQLHSMMQANQLSVRDLYRIATSDHSASMQNRSDLASIGFDNVEQGVARAENE